MGTIIHTTAIHTEAAPIDSVTCSARAAERCIEAAQVSKADIGLIINTGVYREKNIVEPAMAALIQTKLAVNLDPIFNGLENSTFSFDLLNGPVGFLNAVQVAGSMLANRRCKNALIVSNDVHPSVKPASDFPFSQVGTAVLLKHSEDENVGFGKLTFKTSVHTDPGFRGVVRMSEVGQQGRDALELTVKSDYIGRLMDFTVSAVSDFLGENSGAGGRITHVLCSLPTPSFARDVARSLSLPPEIVVNNYQDHGDAHSSALAASYFTANSKSPFKHGDTILFIGAGAGLTCGCGLYQV